MIIDKNLYIVFTLYTMLHVHPYMNFRYLNLNLKTDHLKIPKSLIYHFKKSIKDAFYKTVLDKCSYI